MPSVEDTSPPNGLESSDSLARLARFKLRPLAHGAASQFEPHVVPDEDEMSGEGAPNLGKASGVNWKHWLFGAVLLGGLVSAGLALARYVAVGRYIYATDDAYVRTDLAIVSPKISGYVEAVGVVDNQHVKAGRTLVRIDAGDYELAVSAAKLVKRLTDAAAGADWPQWRGPTRDGIAPAGPKLLDTWPKGGPQLVWKSEPIPSGAKGGAGSVVVADGRPSLLLLTPVQA